MASAWVRHEWQRYPAASDSLRPASDHSIAHGRRSAAHLLEGRRRALRAGGLDAVTEQWRIFEHDEPYFFASYWDANSPGGRIHVSAHGWDQDIRFAPAIDQVPSAHARQPARTYRWYQQALRGLRRRARLLHASGSS